MDSDTGSTGVGVEVMFGACPFVAVLLVLLTATPRRYGLPVEYLGAVGTETRQSDADDR